MVHAATSGHLLPAGKKIGGRLQNATTSLLEPEWPGGWNTLKILRHGIKLEISVASLV